MKKIISLLFLMVFIASMALMQASALSEKEYITYLKDKGFANEYIIYAENHFKSYNYTSEQLDSLKDYSDKILAIVMPKNPEVVTKGGDYFVKAKFTSEEEEQILDYVVKAADAMGIQAVVTRGPDSIRYVEFYDASGKKIGTVTPKYNTLKYTGPQANGDSFFVFGVIGLVLVLMAGTFLTTRVFYLKRAVVKNHVEKDSE
ncbi:MAG: hypothetical protein BGN88_06085 [Clostridiales bacterium 43-6]|nr:MAG: hypothetical protein BGN88_06085 [Clostridiales bacterium 43-6]